MKNNALFFLFLSGVYTTFFIMFISCGNGEKRENSGTAKLKEKLVGKWGGLNEKSPVFSMTADSIYYYDRNKSYKYEILDGNVIINFPTSKGVLKRVRIINDTMYFFDEFPDTIRAYRYY